MFSMLRAPKDIRVVDIKILAMTQQPPGTYHVLEGQPHSETLTNLK